MALHFSRNPPAPAPSTLAYFPPDCPRESRLRFWVAACAAAAGYSLHVLEESLCWPDTDAAHDEVTAAIIGLQAETRGGVLHGSSTGRVSVILRDLPRGDAPDRGTAADLELPEDCELLVEWLSRQRPAMERGQQLAGPGLVVCHLGEGPCGDLDWPVLSWGLTLLLSGPGRGVLIDAQHTAGGLSWALSGQLFGDDDRWPRPDWASERRVAKDCGSASPPDRQLPALPQADGVACLSWRDPKEGPPVEDSALTGLLRHSLGGATVVDVGADLGRAHRLLPDATAGVLVTDGRVRIPPLSGHWLVLDATSESAGAVDGVVHAPVRLWPWTSADPVRRRRRTRSRDALDLGARVEAYLRRLQAAGPDGEREAA